jgi:hypothetical protein
VFDHSASLAEHLTNFLACANHGVCRHFRANPILFGIFPPNAAPTVMQAALRGKRLVGANEMATQSAELLALRPREAAKALGISPRTLWGLTSPRGPIPCVRIGHGGRQNVLYPVADLQAWLSRQAEAAKGGDDDAR